MNCVFEESEARVLKHDFTSQVGYWVHKCAHRFEGMMNAELAGEGISYRQFQILGLLALEGELSQADLARCSGVEPSTIVCVIDRMERDGLIERQPCPVDRRKHLIVPTEAAEAMWKRVLKCLAKVRQCATQGIESADLEVVRQHLMKMHDNMEQCQSNSTQ